MPRKIIGTITLVWALIVPVSAALEVNYHGNISFGAWWGKEWDFTDTITEVVNNGTTKDTIMGEDPYPTTYLDVFPLGLLGLEIKKENLNFYFDMGIGRSIYDFRYSTSNTGGIFFGKKNTYSVRFRKFYAEWNINDAFSLLLGQNSTPCNFSASNQALFGGNGMGNCGVLETGSLPMIQFMAEKSVSDAIKLNGKVAAVMVDTVLMLLPTDYRIKDTTIIDASSGQEVVKSKVIANSPKILKNNLKANLQFPKVEGRFDFSFQRKSFRYNLFTTGGFQQYDILYKPTINIEDPDESIAIKQPIQSYVWGINSDVSIGPVMVAYSCAGGQNLGMYGANIGNPFKWRGDVNGDLVNIFYPWGRRAGYYASQDTGTFNVGDLVDPAIAKSAKIINNSHALEMAWVGKVQPWDFLAIEGGYGLVKASHDDPSRTEWWNDNYCYYGQIEYTIAHALTITPEIGYYYYGHRNQQGKFLYWGLNTHVQF